MDSKRWIDYSFRIAALVLSFVVGSVTGSIASYVNVRTDEAALSARVTITDTRISVVETEMNAWRAEDRDNARQLKDQLDEVTKILTDLRISVGPRHK
jgi:hypothetical protein